MSKDVSIKVGRSAIQHGSKSFALATKIFDRCTRDDASMLYAWCRYCDDVIDGQHYGFRSSSETPVSAVEELCRIRLLTMNALEGASMNEPIFCGLQDVVSRHNIPAKYPLALLQGFQMDVERRVYHEFEDTLDYCYHVAGVVGVMMAFMMGVQDDAALQSAADLGIAFQLTNIARDVMDDAESDRCYLPRRWLNQVGVSSEKITDPLHRKAVFSVISRLLDAAEPYYQSARWGLRSLDFRAAWAVAVARDVYRAIGRRIIRDGPEGLSTRSALTSTQKNARVFQNVWVALRAMTLDRRHTKPLRPKGLWAKAL